MRCLQVRKRPQRAWSAPSRAARSVLLSVLLLSCNSEDVDQNPWANVDVGTDPTWVDAAGTRVSPVVEPNDPPWRIRYGTGELVWSTDATWHVVRWCAEGKACRIVELTPSVTRWLDPRGGVDSEDRCEFRADTLPSSASPGPTALPAPASSTAAIAKADAACEAAYGLGLGGNVSLAVSSYRQCLGPKQGKALLAIDAAALRRVGAEGCRAQTLAREADSVGAKSALAALPASCK